MRLLTAVAIALLITCSGAQALDKKRCDSLRGRISAIQDGALPKGYSNFSKIASSRFHSNSRLEYMAACGGADEYERVRREIHAMERSLVMDCGRTVPIMGGGKMDKSNIAQLFEGELKFIKEKKERFCAYADSEAGSALVPAPAFDDSQDRPNGCVAVSTEAAEVYRFHNRCKFDVAFNYIFSSTMKSTIASLKAKTFSDRLQGAADDQPLISDTCRSRDRDCMSTLRFVADAMNKPLQ